MAGNVPASKEIVGEVARTAMVVPAKAGIVVVTAASAAEPDVDRETRANDGSAKAAESDEGRTSKSHPTAIPTVIDVNEHAWRIGDAVAPTVWRGTFAHVSRPRGIAHAVVPYVDIDMPVIVDGDDLVGAVHRDIKTGMLTADPIALLVERTKTPFAF